MSRNGTRGAGIAPKGGELGNERTRSACRCSLACCEAAQLQPLSSWLVQADRESPAAPICISKQQRPLRLEQMPLDIVALSREGSPHAQQCQP